MKVTNCMYFVCLNRIKIIYQIHQIIIYLGSIIHFHLGSTQQKLCYLIITIYVNCTFVHLNAANKLGLLIRNNRLSLRKDFKILKDFNKKTLAIQKEATNATRETVIKKAGRPTRIDGPACSCAQQTKFRAAVLLYYVQKKQANRRPKTSSSNFYN